MASNYSSEALTLHVSDLTQATSFYLSALSPLGYGFISKVQHQTSTASSDSIGIGPSGSSRVDVFLSQSTRANANPVGGAHVVFTAASTVAVRDFYAAALRAGGRPIARPDTLTGSDGMFATIVTDMDGNQIEVCFGDESATQAPNDDAVATVPGGSQAGSSIQRWADGVAESTAAESVASSSTPRAAPSAAPSQPLRSAFSTAKSFAASQPARAAMSAATAPSQASSKRSASRSVRSTSTRSESKSSMTSVPSITAGNNKTMVGTLIGAAAGAALAYTMVRSKQDSEEQRDEHDRKMRAHDVKAEARMHFDAVDRRQSTGKVELADRDSGYGSGSQYSASPPMLNQRRVTYPQPGTFAPSSRGRAPSRQYSEFGERRMSPSSYYRPGPSRAKSVSGSSGTTIKPVQRSQSHVSRRSSLSRQQGAPLGLPPAPPQPPRMPSPPPSRSRRNSYSGPAPSIARHSCTREKQPPSSFSRVMGGEASRFESPKLIRAPSSHHSSRSGRNVPLPASEAPSASTARPPSSHRSYKSARDVPLPASEAPSRSTVKRSGSRRSSATVQRTPLPPSEAPTKLTARALSFAERSKASKPSSRIDDLATVVPDDSISNISLREERRERESRASQKPRRAGSNTSRRLSQHA